MDNGFTLHDKTALIQGVVPTIVALLAILLRFAAWRLRRGSLGLEDIFAVVAFIFQIGLMGLMIWLTKNGAYQYPLAELPDSLRRANLIVVYAGSFMITGIEAATKLSLLFFYLRIFHPDQSFRYPVWALIMVTLIWTNVCVVGSVVRCTPVAAFWEPEGTFPEAVCADAAVTFVISETVHCAIELAMIALAAIPVRKLQKKFRMKLIVSGIFAIGILNIVVSVVRIVETYSRHEINQSFLDNGAWVAVQSVTAIWVACLPTFGPLLRSIGAFLNKHCPWATPRIALGGDDESPRHTAKSDVGTEEENNGHRGKSQLDRDDESIVWIGCQVYVGGSDSSVSLTYGDIGSQGLQRGYGGTDCV